MDIKTFVAQSLQQIIEGVEQTQKQFRGSINTTFGKSNSESVSQVEFDVAVTIDQSTETKGGIAIFGGAFNLGTQGGARKAITRLAESNFPCPFASRRITTDHERLR